MSDEDGADARDSEACWIETRLQIVDAFGVRHGRVFVNEGVAVNVADGRARKRYSATTLLVDAPRKLSKVGKDGGSSVDEKTKPKPKPKGKRKRKTKQEVVK